MADPLHQFQIQKIVDLPDVTLPGLGPVDRDEDDVRVVALVADRHRPPA